MGYDERLAERIRTLLPNPGGIRERKMFGGMAYLVNGPRGCGIVGDRLMVRVHRDAYGCP